MYAHITEQLWLFSARCTTSVHTYNLALFFSELIMSCSSLEYESISLCIPKQSKLSLPFTHNFLFGHRKILASSLQSHRKQIHTKILQRKLTFFGFRHRKLTPSQTNLTSLLFPTESLPLVTTLVAIIGGILFLIVVVVVIALFKKKGRGYKGRNTIYIIQNYISTCVESQLRIYQYARVYTQVM